MNESTQTDEQIEDLKQMGFGITDPVKEKKPDYEIKFRDCYNRDDIIKCYYFVIFSCLRSAYLEGAWKEIEGSDHNRLKDSVYYAEKQADFILKELNNYKGEE